MGGWVGGTKAFERAAVQIWVGGWVGGKGGDVPTINAPKQIEPKEVVAARVNDPPTTFVD